MPAFRSFIAVLVVTMGFFACEVPTASAQSKVDTVRMTAVQVVAQINAVRKTFGLPPGKVTHRFDGIVRQAAVAGRDPLLPNLGARSPAEFGLWGLSPNSPPVSTNTTQSVINGWVYEDGWMGANTWNLDCTSPAAPNCNGHRRAVLTNAPVPGALLSIDVAAIPTTWQQTPSMSLAVLMYWTSH